MTPESGGGALDRLAKLPEKESAELIAWMARVVEALDDIRARIDGKRKDFYTTDEVAQATGRSEYTIRRWVREGRIQAVKVPGTGPRGRLLIAHPELQKLVAQGRAGRLSAVVVD